MKNQWNALLLSAALAGLTGGTAVAAHAQNTTNSTNVRVAKAGLRYIGYGQSTDKHSCKGKNDCKGKNSCKGKGGCATDGSKPPHAFVA